VIEAREFAFGPGRLVLSEEGAVAAVPHPTRGHSMLLEEGTDGPESVMHDPTRRWGKGFVITDRGGRRFDTPASITWSDDGVEVVHDLGGLTLTVRRRVATTWTETYELRNGAAYPLTLGSIAVSTPWRDVYGSSRESLRRAVHAHVWTGGADSWVWAVPMDGSGPGLGLRLTEGELWAYSVESRDAQTSSNVRGHLYLHVTDHARAPHAMGGQPRIALAPGASYRWAWELDWYADLDAFRSARPVIAGSLTAEVGEAIEVVTGERVTGTEPGVRDIILSDGGRRSRVSVLFHPPLRDLVESRIRFVLDKQRSTEQPGSRGAAFVPFDNPSGLTVLPGAWRDWSDARERVGTAALLQAARDRGWCDRAELDDALADYEQFVVEHVVDEDGTVRDDTWHDRKPRLYNFPWFARFLLDQDDLDGATRIADRYYELGGEHFLAFGLGSLLTDLAGRLAATGRKTDAEWLRGHLLRHARTFIGYGDDLPPHEVNYEQSMVAPLLELLLAAYRTDPSALSPDDLRERLRWLRAFAADQPDVRMRHVPIRHWDGYWFGRDRLWGDVFPHYWSVLSAEVFLGWPDDLADPAELKRLRTAGRAILRANLANFAPDGSATCAFVYPSCVDGRPAHTADPLANDQDWALVYALRLGLD
jgi:hypothetical protein